jgi:hypothetical protein
MRNLTAAALVLTLSCPAGTALFAQDVGAPKPAGATSAPETAEAWFAVLRKAATDKDEATLAKGLPATLVKDWPDEAAGDAKPWRAAFAERIAAGTVVSVKGQGDDAVARWKTDKAVWETRLHRSSGQWTVASPWAWLVGGADLAKVNGAKPAHVKLTARTDPNAYGPSAFSFVHVTQKPSQCLNRMDIDYCRCGQMHLVGGGVLTVVKGAKLDALDGLQSGGDWQDEMVPKNGTVYVLGLKHPGRNDVQVAIEITALSATAMEFDWRVIAAGKNAPAGIHAPQPIVSNDGTDGSAQLCDPRK